MKSVYKKFLEEIKEIEVSENVSMSGYTTVGLGGPADLLCIVKNIEELKKVCCLAFKYKIPFTVLGMGSNVLVADRGIRGLVVINNSGEYKVGKKIGRAKSKSSSNPVARLQLSGNKIHYKFEDLDYDESDCQRIKVTTDSGVRLASLMGNMFEKGITGLQWYAGIPSTLGGAVWNNLHGGTHFFSEVVDWVEVLDPSGKRNKIAANKLGADYDKSIFHESDDVILRVGLKLYLGDAERAKFVAHEWRTRKQKVQPQKTPGCIFANITQEERDKAEFPTTSVGYIIEQELKMTGYRVGNAFVSPKHHNFVETDEGARSEDYLQVIKDMSNAVYDKFKIKIKPEIIFLGFKKIELRGLWM